MDTIAARRRLLPGDRPTTKQQSAGTRPVSRPRWPARAGRWLGVRTVLLTYAALLILYAAALHPWLENRGSAAIERWQPLPGDELNSHPRWQTTRALTVNAPADEVWAWLIQHGQDRAGFYSYDWLENLTGADIHNANVLRPEWQDRAVGDGILMARPDLLGGAMREASTLRVRIVEPGRALATTSASGDASAWVLVPVDAGSTRLVVRERVGSDGGGGVMGALDDARRWLVWDPMHFVMQHRMLLGLKARAEGHPDPPLAVDLVARAGWLAAGGVLLALFLRRRRVWHWLALPAVATLPALLTAGDVDAALAGFLAVGITTLGAASLGWRWWPPFALLGAGVLLVLLLAPDAYIAFGLIFGALAVGAAGWTAAHARGGETSVPGRPRSVG